MAKFRLKEIKDKNTWEKYNLERNPKSFLQSWSWGEVNRKLGNNIIRIGVYKGDRLEGIALLIEQKAKRGLHYIVPAGPVIDWKDTCLANFILEEISTLVGKRGGWFVRVRPEAKASTNLRTLFKESGFVSAPMHLHGENTLIIDISKSEKEILSAMRKNTRYSIRKSLKQNLKLETTTNPSDAEILFKLQKKTVARHGFVGFSKKIFEAELEEFGKDGQASLFIVKKGRGVLAASIIVFYKDTAYYHFSGSTSKARETNAGYFLQWKTMLEAKSRGCKYYDMWGIAPTDDPKHRFAGVTVYKKGFGGKRINWLHAQDKPLSYLYWGTYAFEQTRKFMRGL